MVGRRAEPEGQTTLNPVEKGEIMAGGGEYYHNARASVTGISGRVGSWVTGTGVAKWAG